MEAPLGTLLLRPVSVLSFLAFCAPCHWAYPAMASPPSPPSVSGAFMRSKVCDLHREKSQKEKFYRKFDKIDNIVIYLLS
jgi:hypothetical protein